VERVRYFGARNTSDYGHMSQGVPATVLSAVKDAPRRVVPRVILYSVSFLTVIPGIGACHNADLQGGGPGLVILTTSSLHLGLLRHPYRAILTSNASNAISLRWSVSLGALPPGLRLDPSRGEIVGMPTQGGSFSFTIAATEDAQVTASKTLHLDIFDEMLDDYGGFAEKHSLRGKTGFFRLERAGNRWLFVDPLGNYFFPLFVEDMDTFDGGSAYKNAVAAKYTGGTWSSNTWTLFTQQMVRRARSWGFNAIGVGASNYTLPIVSYYSDGPNSEKMPFVDMIRPALYGVRDGGVEDLIFGSDPTIYNGWRGASFPDIYSPLFSQAIQAEITAKEHALGTALDQTSWLIGEGMDDMDYLFGWRNSTNSPHTGWLTAITSPVQTYSIWPWYSGIRTLHTDTQVYTKTAWSSFLQQRYGTIQELNATWKSNYTTFGSSGVPITREILGTGDGSTKDFSKPLAHSLADPHSVAVFESGKMVAGDDGLGHIGSSADAAIGSVNYTRGLFSVTFKTAPAAGAAITVNYVHGGWPKRITGGAGLLDEDGSSPWIGKDFLALSGTNPMVKADMDAFLQQQLETYFSQMSSAIHNWLPHHVIFGPSGLSPMTRPLVFREAGKYIDYLDVAVDDFDVQPAAGLSQAFLNVYSYFPQPIEAGTTITSQRDSPWASFPRSLNDYPNQAARGQAYATKLGAVVNLKGPDGVYFVVDFDIFAWTDKRAESANFGLVSNLDNAYDGVEDQTTIGYDSWGFKTGGERRNYGDFIDSIEVANLDAIRKVASGIAASKPR
jgi:Putative Ig domain